MRRFLQVLLLTLVGLGVAWMLGPKGGLRPGAESGEPSGARLVSLSPAITEVIAVLGKSDQLVGISDYCDESFAPAGRRAGTSLSPNFEQLARLSPHMILTQQTRNAPMESLRQIGPVQELPWLTVDDVVNSVRRIGMTCGAPRKAEELATSLEQALDVPIPTDGPLVLFVLAHTPGQLSEVIYVRDDSLHGHALRSAGGQNVKLGSPSGVPQLSIEAILALDPSGIIILGLSSLGESEKATLLEDWKALSPLQAVQNGRIAIVDGRSFSTGPSILEVVRDLRSVVESWSQ